MDKDELRNMIVYAVEEKPTDFADTFNNYMMDKVHASINNKKIEYAKSMFNKQSANTGTSEE